jgi:competence protein ComGF
MKDSAIYALWTSITIIQLILVIQIGVNFSVLETELNRLSFAVEELVFVEESRVFVNGSVDLNKVKLNGLYYKADDYYCVWAKERDPLRVSKTEAHEYCHYLIDNGEWEHFCGED